MGSFREYRLIPSEEQPRNGASILGGQEGRFSQQLNGLGNAWIPESLEMNAAHTHLDFILVGHTELMQRVKKEKFGRGVGMEVLLLYFVLGTRLMDFGVWVYLQVGKLFCGHFS